jgi:hypothetical protein
VWALVAALATATLGVSANAPAGASQAAGLAGAGNWTGSGQGRRTGGDRWARVAFTYTSTFWFTVDPSGSASGEAVVSYDLRFDDSHLRAYLGVLNRTAGSAVSLVPGVGALLGPGVSLQDLLGLAMSYDDPAPIRRGKIAGSLKGTTLHLDWASAPDPLPYTWYRVYATREEKMRSASAAAFRPWITDAVVSDANGSLHATAVGSKGSTSSADVGFWVAHRQ